MKLLFGVILLVATAYGLPSRAFHESEKEFEEEFNVRIDSAEEEKYANELKKEEEEINQVNKDFEEGKKSWNEQLYKFSNEPMDEFEKEKEGLIMPEKFRGSRRASSSGIIMPPESVQNDPANAAQLKELYRRLDMNRASLPNSYSSVEQGLVTAPKNQLQCGSCAAFSATGLHETCMLKAGAPKNGLDLSEQYLIDCGFDGESMDACDGAWPHAYSRWLVRHGGMVAHEAKYPYLDRSPLKNCTKAKGREWNSGAKVDNSISDFNANATRIMQLVVEHGAVLATLHVDQGFKNYKSGVYAGCSSNSTNHGVLIVGYGTEKGVDYWLIKNSWGENWGENGFIKVQRGVNMCGIQGVAVTVTCSDSGEAEAAPPFPPPKPIPVSHQCDVTGIFEDDPLTGNYEFIINGIKSVVTCKNSICTPTNPGPTNACMYICNKLKCKRSPTTSTTTTTTTTPAPGPGSQCDLSKRFGNTLNGLINLTFRENGKVVSVAKIKCTSSICRPRVPITTSACEYICGKAQC